ncbi:putative zinc-binding protein [Azospirillum sp.]|uniref:putative zinc-binding protein n=1 Tax=Azospirillum sp. TaxID=34012 RepID=UPI003D71A9AA
MTDRAELPLVYSCSGCSNVAQVANAVALRLDRLGLAEMSCIAGVGGGVKPLVRLATSGRPVVALDGCVLACVKACLGRHGVEATVHHVLTRHDLKKQAGVDPDPDEIERVLAMVQAMMPPSR